MAPTPPQLRRHMRLRAAEERPGLRQRLADTPREQLAEFRNQLVRRERRRKSRSTTPATS